MRSIAFRRLLETGIPATVEAIASDADMASDAVGEVLDTFGQTGGAERHRDGTLIGIAGLTVRPTKHALSLGRGLRWTWCSLDAIGIVGALGAGTITSATNRGDIHISYRGGRFRPDGLAIFLAHGYGTMSSVDAWCPLVDFHPSLDAAEDWARVSRHAGQAIRVDAIARDAADRWHAIITGSDAT